MKKIFAMILALALVLTMSTVAFAEVVTYKPTEATSFEEIVKTYKSENNVVVNETLSFTSNAMTSNPDGGTAKLTVDDLTVNSLNPGTIKVNIPSLSKAGVYEWTIKEEKGTTAGVTYSDAEVHVIVLVEYDNTNHCLKIASTTSYIKLENGSKAKIFENTFKSGSFTVEKKVVGNMANKNDEFEISVTLTSSKRIGTIVNLAGTKVYPKDWIEDGNTWTYTTTLWYSEASGEKTFVDIPVGVTVTVHENTADEKMKGYSYISTKVGDSDFREMTIADDTNAAIIVTNENETQVDTGITTDSLPYVVLLGAVALIGVVMFIKRRAYND